MKKLLLLLVLTLALLIAAVGASTHSAFAAGKPVPTLSPAPDSGDPYWLYAQPYGSSFQWNHCEGDGYVANGYANYGVGQGFWASNGQQWMCGTGGWIWWNRF